MIEKLRLTDGPNPLLSEIEQFVAYPYNPDYAIYDASKKINEIIEVVNKLTMSPKEVSVGISKESLQPVHHHKFIKTCSKGCCQTCEYCGYGHGQTHN